MNLKKLVMAGLCVVMLGFLLTGCLSPGNKANSNKDAGSTDVASTDKPVNKNVTIRIASAETGGTVMKVLQDAGNEYEKMTGIKVVAEAVPLPEIYTKINATYGTSAQYSAFTTGFIGHISLLQEEGRLAPVDEVIEAIGGVQDFFNDGEILYPLDNKVYWIPFDYNLAFGFIRKDWLADKGLSVPKNWDELINVSKAFTNKDKNKYGIIMPLKADDSTNWVTSQVLWANNVRIFDDNWNVILDSPEMKPKVVESLNLLKELYKYMPARADNGSYGDLTESFLSEQVGITFYTGRMLDILIDKNPTLADNFEIFGFPMKDGNGVTTGLGYDGMAVLNTDHTAETKKFLEWFYKEKIIDFLSTAPFHYLPAQKSIYEKEEWRNLPAVKKYWDSGMEPQRVLLNESHAHSIDSDGPSVNFRSGKVFQSMVFPEMYQRVTINKEDPAKVVDDTANKIREMLKK